MKRVVVFDTNRHSMHLSRAVLTYWDTSDGNYEYIYDMDFIKTVYPQCIHRRSDMSPFLDYSHLPVPRWYHTYSWESIGITADGEAAVMVTVANETEQEDVSLVPNHASTVEIDPSNSYSDYYVTLDLLTRPDPVVMGVRRDSGAILYRLGSFSIEKYTGVTSFMWSSPEKQTPYPEVRPSIRERIVVKKQDGNIYIVKPLVPWDYDGQEEYAHPLPEAYDVEKVHVVSDEYDGVYVVYATPTGATLAHCSPHNAGTGYVLIASLDLEFPDENDNFMASFSNFPTQTFLVATNSKAYTLVLSDHTGVEKISGFSFSSGVSLLGGFNLVNRVESSYSTPTHVVYTLEPFEDGKRVIMHGIDMYSDSEHSISAITDKLHVASDKIHMMITGTNSYSVNYQEETTLTSKLVEYIIS